MFNGLSTAFRRSRTGISGCIERNLKISNRGLKNDKIIWINTNQDAVEEGCILAEELGHYHNLINRKQVLTADRQSFPLENTYLIRR